MRDKSIAVLVLGMHRSGTSLLAGALAECGYFVGDRLLPPQEDNPKGFFEDATLVALHDELLDVIGLRWDDPRPLPENWEKFDGVRAVREKIEAYFDAVFLPQKRWALKDPRMSRLLPLWKGILFKRGIKPKIIHVIRRAEEVAKSLHARNGIAREYAMLLWLRYNMEAEQCSRDWERCFVHFDACTRDIVATLADIESRLDLGLDLLHNGQKIAKELFDSGLRHHRAVDRTEKLGSDTLTGLVFLAEDVFSTATDGSERFGYIHRELRKKDIEYLPIYEAYQRLHEEKHESEVGYGVAVRDNARANELIAHLNDKIRDLEKKIEESRNTAETRLNAAKAESSEWRRIAEERLGVIEALQASRSWRITAPLRAAGKAARVSLVAIDKINAAKGNSIGSQKTYSVARRIYHRLPLPEAAKRVLKNPVRRILTQPVRNSYREWIERHEKLSDEDRQRLHEHCKRLAYRPLLSVLLPVYNTPRKFLIACIESVQAQSYSNWELCIVDDASTNSELRRLLESVASLDSRIRLHFRDSNGHISRASNDALHMARGEYVVLLDHDDVLAEDALFYVVCELNKYPDAEIVYSDEDKVSDRGERFDPYFKPDFSYELFLGQNMISHLGVYRTDTVRQVGGFREGLEGAQDWDLALRVLEISGAQKIRHIPRILYHWRVFPGSTALDTGEKPYAYRAQRRALESHLQRVGKIAQVVDNPFLPSAFHRILWQRPRSCQVDIVVPTRNGLQYLEKCVSSILSKTTYPDYNIVIVDNDSDDPAVLEYFARVVEDSRVRVLRVPGRFNFSTINNTAVKASSADVIVLLNNDTEVITADWLDEMVSYAIRADVGAVGAKLFYEDGTIQHGGIIVGLGGYAAHSHRGFPQEHPGQSGRLWLAQDCSAVTAACLAIERRKYLEIGGLDEEAFAVAYNDVDFCLRLRAAGYRNVFTPYAQLYHYESKTRGTDVSPEKKARFDREKAMLLQRYGDALRRDPFYNPNLTLDNEDFGLAFPPRVKLPWEDTDDQGIFQEKQRANSIRPAVERFVRSTPSPCNVLQLYAGSWVSLDPDHAIGRDEAGRLVLAKEDKRVGWAIESLGAIDGFRVLELGPLEGRQSYSLCRFGAREVVGVEGNAACFERMLALKAALEIDCLKPMLGDFQNYLRQAAADEFDLVFASGVLYHVEDPVSNLTEMARVAPRLFLWTHVYERDLPSRHPGWSHRFYPEEHWNWRGNPLRGARQRYTQQDDPKYCGGLAEGSLWLTEESLLIVLHALGYSIVAARREPDHPNGLAVALCAVRRDPA
jgi:GT2 family glycosyltransferase